MTSIIDRNDKSAYDNLKKAFVAAEVNFFNMISTSCLQTDHLQAFATGVQSTSLNHAVVHQIKDIFENSLNACCEFYSSKKVQ